MDNLDNLRLVNRRAKATVESSIAYKALFAHALTVLPALERARRMFYRRTTVLHSAKPSMLSLRQFWSFPFLPSCSRCCYHRLGGNLNHLQGVGRTCFDGATIPLFERTRPILQCRSALRYSAERQLLQVYRMFLFSQSARRNGGEFVGTFWIFDCFYI